MNIDNEWNCISLGNSAEQIPSKPSIVQKHPDPVEMELFVDIFEELSCFRCGVFFPKEELMAH